MKCIGVTSALLVCAIAPPPAWAQKNNEVLVNRKSVTVASIKDPETIKFLSTSFYYGRQNRQHGSDRHSRRRL
jgi:hypothetical protein